MEKDQKYLNDIITCLKSFILKINEKQLKELFELLLSYINEKDDNKEYILSNSIIVLQIFNTLLDVIHDIFVEGYFTKYKNIIIQLIHLSNGFIFKEESIKLGEKRARDNEADDDFNYFKLSCLLLENIKLNFKYSKGKLLVETQEELFDPVIEQFKLSEDEEKMMNYYEVSIQECILEMFKNIQSDDLFKELNDELLNLIREDSYVTKLLVLKMITTSLETLKERYLTQVPDIIPYVSELLEDSNTEVKKYAVDLLKFIEKLTGESYQTYLE
jgi:U3 small nucleolar RNA-associated protein 10